MLGLLFGRPLIGVRAIPRLTNGQVVLVQPRRGGWVLPGGLMDLGEKIRVSLEREILEECGLKVVRFGRLSGIYSAPERDERFHCICVVMEVFVQGEPRPIDTIEILAAAAFDIDKLPETLEVDCRVHLADYLAGEVVVD